MNAPLHTVHGQPSWAFRSSHVHAHLTRLGGHLGPVTFRLGRRTVSPFSVAPWAGEKVAAGTPALLRSLRGDFFCAPFGDNTQPWRGERHPPHGETANAKWRLHGIEHDEDIVTLHASLQTKIRRGRVDKYVSLIHDQAALYQRHVITGASGPMNVGHHAMVKFPDDGGVFSCSRFTHAQVFPDSFEHAANRGYQSLKPGATFTRLERVPLLAGGFTDLTRFPARRGYEDLVMLTADSKLRLAWNAVVFPRQRCVWFALRDPRVLRHTILWISNGGRHYPPWSGRHGNVMGIEDVTSYFHYGLAESAAPNPLNRRGIPTVLKLNPKQPADIRYIIGMAEVPANFDRVRTIRPVPNGIELLSANGRRAIAAVELPFLMST